MPPSPAMRRSPGRELRGDNHKRGRSLESGILLRDKDDDLALFNEMQTRERENFLLQSNDDFDDVFSTKLRYFSDHKLGISIPARGESSDLLNVDGEKNDYDWLLTPPDTPLFPSLDVEPPSVTLAERGRPRSQPITISRSSTMEKSHRSSRGSASPNRLSPSPRSGNSTLQTRGRTSLTPQSSPTPSLRHTTPPRRPSTPPSKPSPSALRSSTPTPRRMSTGSSDTVPLSSGVKGTSPVKSSRGNSASPKIRAWQANIPGFSLDAPPNLRTSLADRPASYVRGSSPASRNGRDSSSRSGRQSMSPTATRSVSSSYSHDRDRFSSHSKGSLVSSGDDDLESLQSIHMSNSERSVSRKVGAFANNRAPAFSKKPSKAVLSSSAPKRSFDSALRQMDHRKGPQNMFRPLLSSVPSSTFYVGKAGAAHRAVISWNSSVTTSSNASSDLGTSGAHDTEGSEHYHDDMASECGKALYPDVQDGEFAFEKEDVNEDVPDGLPKVDVVKEEDSRDVHDGLHDVRQGDFSGGARVDFLLGDSEISDYHSPAVATTATSEHLEVKDSLPEVNNTEEMELCSKCGRSFRANELTEGDSKLCQDCMNSDECSIATIALPSELVPVNSPNIYMKISSEHKSYEVLEPVRSVPESSEMTDVAEAMAGQHEEDLQKSQASYPEKSVNLLLENCVARIMAEEDSLGIENQQRVHQQAVEACNQLDGESGDQQMFPLSEHSNLQLDISEGAGISILLRRSSSSKGTVLQGRTFAASIMPYNDPSYVRESTTSMRSSFGHGSTSTSSSMDLSSARQMQTRVQRQLSGKKSDSETYRHDINAKHCRSGSSLSGNSVQAFQGLGLAMSMHEEPTEDSAESEVVCETDAAAQARLLVSQIRVDDRLTRTDTSELSADNLNKHLGDSSVSSFPNAEESASHKELENFQNDAKSTPDQEASAHALESSIAGATAMTNSVTIDFVDACTQSSCYTISEIETENIDPSAPGSPDSESDDVSANSKSSMDKSPEHSIVTTADKDIKISVMEHETSEDMQRVLEGSTVTVEGHGGNNARSLTMEEATDTILFCSSIVHNLAYQAANIAMEKEENSAPLEGSWPTVTILGNSNSITKNHRNGTGTAAKHSSKSKKARRRRVETDTKRPSCNAESVEKADTSSARIVGLPDGSDSTKPPPKLESKCNCTIM
ncbi:hypothetical protein NMG60_11030882 [Bertholletia excelsa]